MTDHAASGSLRGGSPAPATTVPTIRGHLTLEQDLPAGTVIYFGVDAHDRRPSLSETSPEMHLRESGGTWGA